MQRTVNPSGFPNRRFDPYLHSQTNRLKLITFSAKKRVRSSILLLEYWSQLSTQFLFLLVYNSLISLNWLELLSFATKGVRAPKSRDKRGCRFESYSESQKLGSHTMGYLFGERGSRFPWPQAQRQGIAK